MGFWVAITMKGRGRTYVCPSTVTCPSSMHSSRADWVFGDARLISSPTTTLAKMAPGRNSKSRTSWLKTLTPVMSLGSRSGVNCTRRTEQSIERARVLASMVLPTPGTSSSRRCPSASSTVMAVRTTSGLPSITEVMALASRPATWVTSSSGAAATCCAGCAPSASPWSRITSPSVGSVIATSRIPLESVSLESSPTTPHHDRGLRCCLLSQNACAGLVMPTPAGSRAKPRTAGPAHGVEPEDRREIAPLCTTQLTCRNIQESSKKAAKLVSMWITVEKSGAHKRPVVPPVTPEGRWSGVFLGTHNPRLDDKGRLFLPAKFRDRLADGLVVTRGQERCLYVFPMDEFVRLAGQMQQAPTTGRAARDYMRVFLSGASDEVPDKQGRVTIPAALREYAGLSKDCTVIGTGARVEVWDSAAWTAYLESTEQAFSDQSEEVIPGLL